MEHSDSLRSWILHFNLSFYFCLGIWFHFRASVFVRTSSDSDKLVLALLFLHFFCFERGIALGTSLLFLLSLAFKPFLEAIRMEIVAASRYPKNALVLCEWVNADDAICSFKLRCFL